jgi:hypothetical protein
VRTALTKLVAMSMVGLTCVALSSSVATASSSGHPTLAQLEADIAATLKSGHLPNFATTVPTLVGAPKTNEGRFPLACNSPAAAAGVPINAFKSCAVGDRRTKRTIFVFGDDDAAMWIPTFRTLGTEMKWKVVILAKTSCSPWSYGTSADGTSCRRFVNSEVALANEMHPAVIIPIGNKVQWRGTKLASVRYLDGQIQRTLTALKPSRGHVILFSPVPQFERGYTGWTPQICLRSDRGNLVSPCEAVIYNEALTSTASQALFNTALKDKLPLINTRDLFCAGTDCALYVSTKAGSLLVYRDGGHMNLYYANWISSAVEQMVKSYLR